MVHATPTCGHPQSQFLCQRCRTEFCPQCLEDHAKFLASIAARMAPQQGGQAPKVPVWDHKNAAYCPKCAAEFSQARSQGRTIVATVHDEPGGQLDQAPAEKKKMSKRLTVSQFLELCERRDLLPADLLASLRLETGAQIHSNDVKSLSRWLVKHEHLTRYQAQKLLQSDPAELKTAAATSPTPAPPVKEAEPEIWDELPALGAAGANLQELSSLAGQAIGLASPMGAVRRPAKKLTDTNVWDTKLLLIGGGTLLALLIGGAALLWALTRGSADEAFQIAEKDYNGGLYTQAIAKYDKYLASFPSDKNASLARVRRGLARMRQAIDNVKDYAAAIVETKKAIEEIRTEEKFPEARADLAELLPKLAQGLAEQAYAKQDAGLLAKAREAQALVANPNYVSQQLVNQETIRQIDQRLAQVEHNLNREGSLQAAVREIEQFVQAGDTVKAYATRKELLKQYPDLFGNDLLLAAIAKASQAEQATVKFQALDVPAAVDDADSPLESSLPLASPSGGTAPGVEGRVLAVLAEGAVYGLEAATGKVLWRRFVGMDVPCPPLPVSKIVGSDLLLVDSSRQELLRVAAVDGKLKWRQKIAGGTAVAPAVLRQRVLVPSQGNRLLVLNLDDGKLSGEFQFTQRVRTPAVDAAEKTAYVVGHHSNLYVLSLEHNRCERVVYLGHEGGGIRVPPVLVDAYAVMAENIGTRFTQLRVFQIDEREIKQVQAMRLDGQLHSPPLLNGRQLFVATDLAAMYVYDVSPGAEEPLTRTAGKAASLSAPLAPHTLVRGAQLWYADKGLVCYDVQVNTGNVVPRWAKEPGDVFIQPLEAAGDVLFHVRRKAGVRGATVCAARLSDGEHFWETHLAAPAVSGLLVQPRSRHVAALTADGALYKLSVEQVRSRQPPARPFAAIPSQSPYVAQLQQGLLNAGRLASGATALVQAGQSEALLVDADQEPDKALRWLPLPDQCGWAPLAYQGWLLVPGRIGQVYCLDADSGHSALAPFQPRLVAGDDLQWVGALAVAEDDVLLFDGRKRLYRLGPRAQPVEHLAALDEAELPAPLIAPLARLGNTAFAVDQQQNLLAIALPGLSIAATWPLNAGVAWGPMRVGNAVLLATDDDRLLCLDEVDGDQDGTPVKKPRQRWIASLAHGPLSGAPLALGDVYVMASISGTLWTLRAADGKEGSSRILGEPMGHGPVALENNLLLLGYDGTLHLTAAPSL